jgi:hypothetical protein
MAQGLITNRIPNNSLEVFKTGFAHLGLKPGVEELFKKKD